MNQKIIKAPGIIILLIFLYCPNSFSLAVVRTVGDAHKTAVATPDYLKGAVFVNLTAREFAAATGKRLNFFQKISFKIIQHRVRRDLKKNPGVMITDYYDQEKAKFKFDALWFTIAAFVGPLGLLAAYTSHLRKGSPTTKKDKITSAWLGFALFVLWFGFVFVF
ncbi:MAG: hypothetical protein ABI472_15010 [Ginsengibacter sp.]